VLVHIINIPMGYWFIQFQYTCMCVYFNCVGHL